MTANLASQLTPAMSATRLKLGETYCHETGYRFLAPHHGYTLECVEESMSGEIAKGERQVS